MAPVTHRIPGLVLTDHTFTVPLVHGGADTRTIEVFAREVTKPGAPADRPWLVFFQGGPGFPSPRPLDGGGWVGRAAEDYRVLLLDQRGTGRSTPVLAQTVGHMDPEAQAEYLTHFRADAIVQDAEFIRRALGVERWSVLGQSFGGFCVTQYLSAAPDGLREAFITGGLPPIGHHPDVFYRATHRRMIDKTRRFYERYPGDADLLQRIAGDLASREVLLPDGARLTPERLQQLGWAFGMSDGFEQVHNLLDGAYVRTPRGEELSAAFLRGVWQTHTFETNPIYAVIHEACACDGSASEWSAQRVRREFPELEPDPSRPLMMTGESIMPWMFAQYPLLRPFAQAADILAAHEWPRLYDRQVLAANTVPTAAVMYYDDMYVERVLGEETAAAIAGLRVWVTNEYEHNGLRADGRAVLDHLFGMVRGER